MCLTRNRRRWLPQAIECLRAQTYSNLRLLIVADGDDVRDLIPSDPRIRLIHLAEIRNIGEKRNFGCSQAETEIISHWDDDDYSAPDRIAHQVERLNETGLAVAGFHSMRFSRGADWWQYRGKNDFALGTSLCYRRDWWQAHPFQPRQIGEDNFFVARAAASAQLVTEDAGDLMFARDHETNTSPRMMGSAWTKL